MAGKDFSKIGFDDFRRLAVDPELSKYERIGFPDSYREGKEEAIFADILRKLPALGAQRQRVVDIGPGCSELPKMLIDVCERQQHSLELVDSEEMLALLPERTFVSKTAALFPQCPSFIEALRGAADVIICYSVLHYVFVDTQVFRFLDAALSMLAPGGTLLIGDIPNISKRKRFFASETGVRFHREFMGTQGKPEVHFNRIEDDQIDDAVIFALVTRARAAGFDGYVVPQDPTLPMANRREDILILRP
jgi:hypothetical protein